MNHPILEQSNIDLIANVCKQFIYEKYQATLEDVTMKRILVSIFKKQVTYFTSNQLAFPPLEDLNKRAIGEVRDFVIEQKQKQAQPQHSQQAQHSQQMQSPQINSPQYQMQSHHPPQQNEELQLLQQQQLRQREDLYQKTQNQQISSHPHFNPLPPPEMKTFDGGLPPISAESFTEYSETIVSENRSQGMDKNEDEFFQRLQLLEIQRQQNINLQQPTSNPISGKVEEKTVLVPPAPTNTIIYMNNESTEIVRNIKPVVLKGHERPWIHSPERHTLIFNGPLPDSIHIRLSKILLPKRVSRNTPCVNLNIRSATDKRMEVLCSLDKEGPIWDIWKPISSRLALIKTFACPWTIQLQDVFNNPLSMGKDAIQIINVKQLANNNTKLIIEERSDIDLQSYGQLLVQNKDGSVLHIESLHVLDNQIELNGNFNSIEPNNSYICNLQAQAYIVLEMEKYDGDKEGE